MSKRGRKPKVKEVRIALYCLVELERDYKSGRADRRGIADACRRIEQYFSELGRVVDFATIKADYFETVKSLKSRPEAAALADAKLAELRKERERRAWKIDRLELLGYDWASILPPETEIAIRRAQLQKLEAARGDAADKLQELTAERERLNAERERLAGGKPN